MPQAFSRASPELSGVERIIRTTPKKAHLRHGDSRIEFAAIESSPLASENSSSQLLTSRQEEVREPQELEASAMFPNFDPLTRTNRANSEKALPKLSLKGISSSQSRSGTGIESPMLSNDDILTDFFGSSPTPRSSSRSSRIRPVDCELSPSPSKQPISVSMPQAISTPTTTLSRTAHNKVEDCSEGSNHSHLQQCQNLNDKDFQTSRESSHQLMNPLLETPLGEPTFVDNRIRAGSTDGSDDDLKDTNVLFEIDAFIDAQSAPLPTSECDILEQMEGSIQISSFSPEQIFDSANESVSKSGIQEHRNRYTQDRSVEEASGVINSRELSDLNSVIGLFHKMDSRHIPSEEDQITAQLVNDLERASSQAETDMSVSSSPIKCLISAGNKRKCTFDGIQRDTKKPKTQPGFHIIVEMKNPEVSENGCSSVQKDHRPKTNSPAIGQEQESQLSNSGATNKRSSVKKARQRSKRFSSTNSFSTQDSQATSEEASVTVIKEEAEIIYDVKNTADPHVAPRRRSVRLCGLSKANQGSQGHSGYHKPENVDVSTENEGRPNDRKGSEDMVQQSIEEEEEEDEEVTSSDRERDDPPVQDTVRHEPFATVHELLTGMTGVDDHVEAAPTSPLRTPEPTVPGNVAATDTAHLQDERDLAGAMAASGPAEQGQKATAPGILTEYRALLGTLRQVELGDEDEGKMIRLLCDSLQAVHEAGCRKRGV